MSTSANSEKMKTVLIDGVPCRIRADMPAGYLEMVERDTRHAELSLAFNIGYQEAQDDWIPRGYFS